MSVLTQPRDELGVRQLPVADNRHVHAERGHGVHQRQRQTVADQSAHPWQLDRLGKMNPPEAGRGDQHERGDIVAQPFCRSGGDSATKRMTDQREVANPERRQSPASRPHSKDGPSSLPGASSPPQSSRPCSSTNGTPSPGQHSTLTRRPSGSATAMAVATRSIRTGLLGAVSAHSPWLAL
jgi:hypothetical protein